ncbi:MAG: hypothetical protein JO278_14615, partial [Dyella sp.]|nr:hypothetical protein [Dyella sp.]
MAGVLLGLTIGGGVHAATAAAPTLRWNADQLGNHRYLVQVAQLADAVHVVIPWRRRDAHPEQVNVIITGPDGQTVANVRRGTIDRASG